MTEVKTTLDITREVCPMTYVRTKLRLEALSEGEVLEVLLRGEEPLKNVPASAILEGHEVVSLAKLDDDTYRLLLRKHGGRHGNGQSSDPAEDVHAGQS